MAERVLNGWKGICGYLGCCRETARKWMLEEGLPVRGGCGKRVFAYVSEIETWRQGVPLIGAGSMV